MKKILLGLLVIVLGFLGYVTTRPDQFRYERSGVIQAPPEKIFPFISNFKLGNQWNPYAQKDPKMVVNFKGPDAQIGSIMEFEGNAEAGSGSLEVIGIVPNMKVDIRLRMTKPIAADNIVTYHLAPEPGGGTRFTWTMLGKSGFIGKLVSVFIDCEKMVAGDFEKGISNLKVIMEAAPKSG